MAATTARAASSLDLCEDQRNDCDEALNLADQVIGQQEQTISALDQQNKRLMNSLEDATAEATKEPPFYQRPSVVFPAGFILGIVAGIYATRH